MLKLLKNILKNVAEDYNPSNIDRFESYLIDCFRNFAKEQIVFLKSEGYKKDDVVFAMLLQNSMSNLKKSAFEIESPVGLKMGLSQLEINQSIDKVFYRCYSELFV